MACVKKVMCSFLSVEGGGVVGLKIKDTLPEPFKTFLLSVPDSGFLIYVLKKVGYLGSREALNRGFGSGLSIRGNRPFVFRVCFLSA